MRRPGTWLSALLPTLLLVGTLTTSGAGVDSAGSSEPTVHLTVTGR